MEDAQKERQQRRELRAANLAAFASPPDESALKSLDSSLKRCGGFPKKIKAFSETPIESLLADFHALNLTKCVR